MTDAHQGQPNRAFVYSSNYIRVLKFLVLFGFLAFALAPGKAGANTITEIIDSSGDGSNSLDAPIGMAVDGSGNVYVSGIVSENAFKITPGGVITEIIDITVFHCLHLAQ